MGVDPLHLRLFPVAAGAAVANDRAQQLVAVPEHVGLDPDGVAGAPLRGIASVVHRRRRVLDHDSGRRLAWAAFGLPLRAAVVLAPVTELDTTSTYPRAESQARERRTTSHHLITGRPARPRGLPIRRLAGRGGAVVVADAAARSARPASLAVQVAFCVRRVAGPAARSASPVSAAELLDFRERHSSWIGDWERFAGAGAVADQVRFEREWGALRGYARDRGVRLFGDVAIYVAPRSADHASIPSCSRTGSSPVRRPTRSRRAASCGATRCTTGPR